MVTARLVLEERTNKILNVIKARFGLKDKSEALNKFAELYGEDVVQEEASNAYIKKIIKIDERHVRKYAKRSMSLKELDKLCGV